MSARAGLDALLAERRRVILGISGPPGSGKSTLARSIVESTAGAVCLPMDGFHLADVELARLGRSGRKGAVDTFDGFGYLALLHRLSAGAAEVVYAPAFDRALEQPVAGSIPVPPDTRLIVTEGNYLLDDEPPWPAVRALLTQVWYIDAPPELRLARLVDRHVRYGKTPDAARAWVRDVDEPNARRVESARGRADLVIAAQT